MGSFLKPLSKYIIHLVPSLIPFLHRVVNRKAKNTFFLGDAFYTDH